MNLAIFASGAGSNALNIIRYFRNSPDVTVSFVLSNKLNAGIVEAAVKEGVEVKIVSNEEVEEAQKLISLCKEYKIDYIILAGFLRKIPSQLINQYPDKIINIHPSLLPKYGGKGMYGVHVHKAVIDNGEKKSGISIHLVNEEFDKGDILAQFECSLSEDETVESLQQKIHALEHEYFPTVIQQKILND